MDTENIVIKAKGINGDSVEFSIHWDSSIDDKIHIFRTILYFLTYGSNTIDECLPSGDIREDQQQELCTECRKERIADELQNSKPTKKRN